MGVRGAVAVLFNKRFIKSKKASTSNWANTHLTEAQIIYAANDAYAAMRVYAALGLSFNAESSTHPMPNKNRPALAGDDNCYVKP